MPHCMIVVSPYYKDVADYLVQGAKAALDEKRVTYEVFESPGALEIAPTIFYGSMRKEKRGVHERPFDLYIALGCIIRGETSHYDVVCHESARGLTDLSLSHQLPVGNGILTCDNMEQAVVRADPNKKNKGADAALAALSLYEFKHEFTS